MAAPQLALDAAETLAAYLADLRKRAVAAGKASDWMNSDLALTMFPDGTGVISIGTKRCGDHAKPIAYALAEAEAYVVRDEIAEMNLTLGLTADGRFVEEA